MDKMEKAYKELIKDLKQLFMKVNDKNKQNEKELNENKQVLKAYRKEYKKLYNENLELRKKNQRNIEIAKTTRANPTTTTKSKARNKKR